MIHVEILLVTYVVNSLWQTPLFFVAGSGVASLLRSRGVLSIHRVWVATFLLQVLSPLLTGMFPVMPGMPTWLTGRPQGSGNNQVTVTFGPAHLPGGFLPGLLPRYAAVTYAVVLLYFVLRLFLGLRRTAALRESVGEPELGFEVARVWTQCQERFQVQGTLLVLSPRVRTPLTVGWRQPLVLLPPGLLEEMSPEELPTLFAHECAHIHRRDYPLNLLYEILALPLAYHPVFRLTRYRLVESREWVCDALAAEFTGAPSVYARSLLRLATLLIRVPPATATHAIGMLDAKAVERRLMHLQPRRRTTFLHRSSTLALSGLLGLVTCASAWALHTSVLIPRPPQTANQHGPAMKIAADVMAGNVQTQVHPVYPQDARDAHIEGSVVLHAVISKEGAIEQLTVLSGPPELQTSALDAIRQWTYKPYELNGEPVAVETTITVNYKLAD